MSRISVLVLLAMNNALLLCACSSLPHQETPKPCSIDHVKDVLLKSEVRRYLDEHTPDWAASARIEVARESCWAEAHAIWDAFPPGGYLVFSFDAQGKIIEVTGGE